MNSFRQRGKISMEAKERMAEARGKRAFKEETESYGIMTNLKADVNAYDTTRGFLGTTARRMRDERPEVGGQFQTPGTAAEMIEPKGQIASRTDQLRYHLGSAKGTAEEQQLPLRLC